jgi:voltage-gated sodium channel
MLAKIVHHEVFDGICAAAILLNTALLGASTDYSVRHLDELELPSFYKIANKIFSVWFLIELIMRWTAEGFADFLCFSRNRSWNMFDCLVVGTDLIENLLEFLAGVFAGDIKSTDALANMTVMRMLRVLRIARALRVVRLIHFCKDLRLMVLSVIKSGTSLLWSLVLLSIIIYVFGIFLMQAVTQQLSEKKLSDELGGQLLHWFGSLSATFYSLFLAVTGGVSWIEISDPLIEAHWWNGLVLSFYIFFTVMAMMNIITGIFVETAMSSVSNDNDEVIQAEMVSENSAIKQLSKIFYEADHDQTGLMTSQQFEELLANPRPRALMARMGLQIHEAQSMFSLLDPEFRGYISIEEFLVGCMRMRGGAKTVDLHTLMCKNTKLLAQIKDLKQYVRGEFVRMDNFEDRMDKMIWPICKHMTEIYQEQHRGLLAVLKGSPYLQHGASAPTSSALHISFDKAEATHETTATCNDDVVCS